MPRDDIKAVRPLKAAKPDAGGANIVNVPVLAVVKDNIDPNRSGRIMVYISDNSGSDPDDRSNWVQVSYLSPFFGRTNADGGSDNFGSYKANPSSYGMWYSPPDIGTTVICLFVNGDMNYGFYIGAIPDPDALQMIPAIGAAENVIPNKGEADSYGGAVRLPVTNINSNNKGVSDTPEYLTAPKPIHTYSAAIMFQQGILRDPIRGPISSSAQREPASRVGWGVSTPGRPIYEGGYDDQTIADNLENNKNSALRVVARRGGHSIVMDDGDVIGRDQLVRIRTALGHQILMSDDGQTLMILHSNGQSYIELGKEGTVDVYSTNSVNVRTQGDLNLHADNNINLNAAKAFNIKAESIQIDVEKDFLKKIGGNHKLSISGLMTMKATGAMSLESTGDASFASQATAYVNGKKINLNTGKTGTIPQDVKALTLVAHTDTLFDKTKGYLAAPGKLQSIVSRAPAHTPWADAGLGVDVKVNVNASSQLPSPPKPEVAATNTAAETTVQNPVTPAQVAKQDAPRAVSQSIDKPTTNALLGQMENETRAGPAAQAATKGVAVVDNQGSKEVAIGLYGLTAKQLESSGFIKPGSAVMVESQINAGKTPEQALPDNVWTGKSGIMNLQQFRDNKSAQADAAVGLMQQSQTALVDAAIIKGTEAPPQIAGLVMSGAKTGVEKTIETVKGLGSIALQAGVVVAANKVAGKVNATVSQIASGNFAASVAQNVAGGLGSIGQALVGGKPFDPKPALLGVAGAAFSEIAAKMPRLKPGIPQNLAVIVKQSLEEEWKKATQIQQTKGEAYEQFKNLGASGETRTTALGVLTKVAKDVKTALPGVVGAEIRREVFKALPGGPTQIGATLSRKIGEAGTDIVGNLLENPANIVSQFANPATYTNALKITGQGLSEAAVATARNAAANASASFAAGLRNIPGGQKITAAFVNKVSDLASNIPGTNKISALVKDISTSALSGAQDTISRIRDPLDRLASTGLPAAAAAQLQAAISSIGSSAAVSIKLPTVATNTLDRTEITENFNSLLDDPGIPKPVLAAEVTEAAASKFEELEKQRAEKVSKAVKYRDFLQRQKDANTAYKQAVSTLPAGDPEIERKRQELISIATDPEFQRLSSEISGG